MVHSGGYGGGGGLSGVRKVQDLPCPFRDGEIDELATGQSHRGSAGVLECLDDLSSPVDVVLSRTEGGVDGRKLSGVDGGLAEQAEVTAVGGLADESVGVVDVRVDAVDRWGDAGGASNYSPRGRNTRTPR